MTSDQSEQQRLATLYALGILDTPAEERFDRITRLAQRIFGVPISLVTLIDAERQWFKARRGLAMAETPRAMSFCAHAMQEDDVMQVTDASVDPRFAANPLVTGDPEIRFYAGAPIEAPDGARLGTLCVIDRQPRSLGEEEVEILRDLAAMIEREIAALELAMTDDLTGISNRRGFLQLGGKVLQVCRRRGMPAVVVAVDVDEMKAINDLSGGHAEGDRALVEVAELLCSTFRGSDVIARVGGDEFCVLLTGVAATDAEVAVDRLAGAVAEHNARADRRQPLSLSVGRAGFDPGVPGDLADLLARADQAMYSDKRARRAS